MAAFTRKKPYWHIPIVESNEPLVPIPGDRFVCAAPHPYVVLGAPYGNVSPFFVRQGVLVALEQAQSLLQAQHPHWKIFIFDAYRPVAVQKFMVDFTFAEVLHTRGLERSQLSESETAAILEEVYQLWAPPILDLKTPPPHSTGAAVDVTLFDTQTQETIFMGSPIDEFSPRSHPDYFGNLVRDAKVGEVDLASAALADTHRQLLHQMMHQAGFQRHPGEWWHFSLGDQMWAWLETQVRGPQSFSARYGRVTLA
jgi:zinc D-Ala-D-Ala dipeptidase